MRPTLALFFVCFVHSAACTDSHPPGDDSSDGGPVTDGATPTDGLVGLRDGSLSRPDAADPGDDAGRRDRDGGAGVAPVDLVSECVTACDHLLACNPTHDRTGCVSDCLDLRGFAGTADCEAKLALLFACIEGLDCARLGDGDISDTECMRIVDGLEADCSDVSTGRDPGVPPAYP